MNPRQKKFQMNATAAGATVFALVCNFACLESLQAQATGTDSDTEEEIVELSPFEVIAERDSGYIATDSNSIARFKTDLQKTPVSTDIITAEFMSDTGLIMIEDILAEYGAGSGDVFSRPEENVVDNEPGVRTSTNKLGVRGLTAGRPKRDGFAGAPVYSNATSTFDIERVEVVRGPSGGMLFGASGAGGSVYTISKQATFNRFFNKLTFRLDQYGSKYVLLDTNIGKKWLAIRAALVMDDTAYRRLFLSKNLDGAYVQVGLRPFRNTIIRLSTRYTKATRIIPKNTSNLNFRNATYDPRHFMSLSYLLATGKAAATDPATGEAYPAGAIANGLLNWENQQSWAGWADAENADNHLDQVTVDTVWTRWLSTSFGFVYTEGTSQLRPDGGMLLPPGAFNASNPFPDEWASSSNFRVGKGESRSYSYRAAALFKAPLFNGKVRTQTSIGFDYVTSDRGSANHMFYMADENGNIIYDKGSAEADALGRIAMPTLYWSVQNGPVKQPYFKMGTEHVVINGTHYALGQQNPRSAEWISPLNPLGLASLAGMTGISGDNTTIHDKDSSTSYGYYITNFSSWFNDRVTTLAGWRTTTAKSIAPNVSPEGTEAYTRTRKNNSSYGVGISYAVRQGLNLFYNYARSFEAAGGGSDPMGEEAKSVRGTGHEIGLKLSTRNRRYAVSMQYFAATSENEVFIFPTTLRDLVNPIGINGFHIGPTGERGTWVPLDKSSSGFEIILTANPTRNWRVRLAATTQNGKLDNGKSYSMIWNDEFYYDKATGGVTYANGDPFIVPTDSRSITQVSRLNKESAPIAGTTNEQLTLAMLNDPNSEYYAYGLGSEQTPNGQLRYNSTVYRALRWFNKPVGGAPNTAFTGRTGLPLSAIPYAYDDPVGYNGEAVFAKKGEKTVGHPLYRITLTSNYSFSKGWLKGLGIGGTINLAYDNRTYNYTEPDGKGGNTRLFFKAPLINPQINVTISYQKKFKNVTWRTQLNISNVFNHYKIQLTPNNVTGYTIEDTVNAAFFGQPRMYVWTNMISF